MTSEKYTTYPESVEEENLLMKDTLRKIKALEEKFDEPHPEFRLLQACALAKEALKKVNNCS